MTFWEVMGISTIPAILIFLGKGLVGELLMHRRTKRSKQRESMQKFLEYVIDSQLSAKSLTPEIKERVQKYGEAVKGSVLWAPDKVLHELCNFEASQNGQEDTEIKTMSAVLQKRFWSSV
ncbi:MAG: hypothetical protein CL946_08740 [Ectothiorhodospiraceae bacterium]|nr:hypothetical protein [Ectothiorhodospiraceae bacterium]